MEDLIDKYLYGGNRRHPKIYYPLYEIQLFDCILTTWITLFISTTNSILQTLVMYNYECSSFLLFFFFSFRVLHLMLTEAPQPYGLLCYPRIGLSNFLHQFRAATPPKQRKLEL
jgi:hypothetical protein